MTARQSAWERGRLRACMGNGVRVVRASGARVGLDIWCGQGVNRRETHG